MGPSPLNKCSEKAAGVLKLRCFFLAGVHYPVPPSRSATKIFWYHCGLSEMTWHLNKTISPYHVTLTRQGFPKNRISRSPGQLIHSFRLSVFLINHGRLGLLSVTTGLFISLFSYPPLLTVVFQDPGRLKSPRVSCYVNYKRHICVHQLRPRISVVS